MDLKKIEKERKKEFSCEWVKIVYSVYKNLKNVVFNENVSWKISQFFLEKAGKLFY